MFTLPPLVLLIWSMPIVVGWFLIIATKYPYSVSNKLISSIINTYLLFRYPIRSVDGKTEIPTCPYRWPNGQGDTGKFLEGERNSDSWRVKYGQVYRVWSGMNAEIVLSQPKDVQTVFTDSDRHIKAVNNDSGWLMSELLGKCVGLISGHSWKTLRVVCEVPFLRQEIKSKISSIRQQTKSHLEALHNEGDLERGVLNPVEDLKFLPFWIIARILYGELTPEMKLLLEDLIPLRTSLQRHVITGGLTRFSWSRYFPLSAVTEMKNFKSRWSEFNDLALRNAQRSIAPTAISEYYAALTAGRISREEMLHTMDEILFANLDVTMGGISWVLMFLAANPSEQGNIRQEVIPIFSETVSMEKQYRYFMSSSTRLAISITESSRLKPLAAFSIPQAAPTPRIVGGFIIPAGTNYIVDTCALNTHNTFWGDDGKKYRPSRFLEKNLTNFRYNFWRFGFGPRVCMGKTVADVIMRVLVAHLVIDYELGLIEGQTSWAKNKETWIAHPDTVIRCEKYLYKEEKK